MIRQSLCALTLLVGIAAHASAAPFTVYGTGTTAAGTAVPGNLSGVADLHYSIASGPSGAGPMYLTVVDGFPIGPWVANDSQSRWISPTNDDHDANSDTVPFVVVTTFDLAGLDPTTAQITGKWAADNGGAPVSSPTTFSEIKLNGNSTGNVANAVSYFGSLYAFAINPTAGFVAGLNTLQFVVYNSAQSSGNPMGLRVQIDSATADPAGGITAVPEPASLALLGFGLVAMSRRLRAR